MTHPPLTYVEVPREGVEPTSPSLGNSAPAPPDGRKDGRPEGGRGYGSDFGLYRLAGEVDTSCAGLLGYETVFFTSSTAFCPWAIALLRSLMDSLV